MVGKYLGMNAASCHPTLIFVWWRYK